MTLVPPPPPAPASNKPPFDNINAWLDIYYYELGLNPIPVVTRYKAGKKGYDWKEWQTKSIPEELFQQWKKEGAYSDGIGLQVRW